jgi:hypothetical protein
VAQAASGTERESFEILQGVFLNYVTHEASFDGKGATATIICFSNPKICIPAKTTRQISEFVESCEAVVTLLLREASVFGQ